MNSDRRYLLFALVACSLLVSSTQGSMVSVALPDMIDDLHAPLRWVGWVITIYALAQAIAMPIAGKLSDELGRRTVFIGGIALFGVASLGAAFAPNVYVLIAMRVVQGLAGGSLLPSAYGVVGDAFAHDRTRAIGMISTIFPIGALLGPLIGGLIVEQSGWRGTFMLNGPPVALLVVAALVLMPSGGRRERRPMDVWGAVWLSLGVVAIMYALTELSQNALAPNLAIVTGAFVIAAVALVAFVRRESSAEDPLVDLQLLRQRQFAYVNTLNFFYGALGHGLFAFIPLYAATAYSMSSAQTGALLAPRAIAMVVASTLAAYALKRTGYRKPIIVGVLLITVALVVLSRGLHTPALGPFVLSDFVYLAGLVAISGVAFGITGPAENNAGLELAPDRVAAITGLRGMFRHLGGALGIAFVVLVASRASSEAVGLQQAFIAMAVVSLASVALVFGIPDGRGGGATDPADGEALPDATATDGPAPLPASPGMR